MCVWRSDANTFLEREDQKSRSLLVKRISPYSFIKGTKLEGFRTMALYSSPFGPYLDFKVCWDLHIGRFEGTVGLLSNLSNRTTFITPQQF